MELIVAPLLVFLFFWGLVASINKAADEKSTPLYDHAAENPRTLEGGASLAQGCTITVSQIILVVIVAAIGFLAFATASMPFLDEMYEGYNEREVERSYYGTPPHRR